MKKLLLTFVLLLPLLARASTVYNNLGPGNSYDCCTGWSIGLGYTQGDQFTASITANLALIDIALVHSSGPSNADVVSLYTDAGGTPGTLLEQWTAANLPNFGSSNSPIVLLSSSHPLLMAGNQYWLIASPVNQNSDNPWLFNTTGAVGDHYSNGGISSDIQGAFAVFGPVPEPASMFLLGTGLVAGAASLRKLMKKS